MSLSDGWQALKTPAIRVMIRRKDKLRMTCFIYRIVKKREVNLKILKFDDYFSIQPIIN